MLGCFQAILTAPLVLLNFCGSREKEVKGHSANLDVPPDALPEILTEVQQSVPIGNASEVIHGNLNKGGDIEQEVASNNHEDNCILDDPHVDLEKFTKIGLSFYERFERFRKKEDLERAVQAFQRACDSSPDDNPNKPLYLGNLGAALQTQFDHFGERPDFDNALLAYQCAVDHIPEGHPNKPTYLTKLGNAFKARFDCFGERPDLENALTVLQCAVDLTPDGHPDKPTYLINLGNAFQTRSDHFGERPDVENALLVNQRAVDLTPDGHHDKPAHLTNLGNAFQTRFNHSGERPDLENALLLLQRAVDLTPDGHPNKPLYLTNLGNTFQARFDHFGERPDLENALLLLQRAVDLTPNGHSNKPAYLTNLGNAFKARFEHFGERPGLENALLVLQCAVDLTPDGHCNKPAYLTNLGNAFHNQFEHFGERSDLENALLVKQRAVDLTPDGHRNKPTYLTNLGNAFHLQFEHFGERQDLENALLVLQRAVDLTPDGYSNKPAYLTNLGHALQTRFDRFREQSDLKNALLVNQRAVDLTPDGHSNKPAYLTNLGNAFKAQFEHFGEQSYIENALLVLQRAVDLTPDGHYKKPLYLNYLGNAFYTRFEQHEDLNDAYRAIFCFAEASAALSGSPLIRFRCARRWAQLASQYQCKRCHLDAHAAVIQLIQQVAWLGSSTSTRYERLVEVGDAANEAAAAAISAGDTQRAIEWLEEGRAVVWGQILRLRAPLDDLRAASPELADRFQSVLTQLGTHGSYQSSHGTSASASHASPEQLNHRYRTLVFEHEKLIEEVRALPGMDGFQTPRRMVALRNAAKSGPVVILNIAKSRCDALVLPDTSGEIIHIPLPNLTHENATTMQDCLFRRLLDQGIRARGDFGHLSLTTASSSIEDVVRDLWRLAVQPILLRLKDVLNRQSDSRLPRVTWCGMSQLPMHAAGIYDPSEQELENDKTFHHVVSSYTPTLSALIESHRPPHSSISTPHLLSISQPHAPDMGSLVYASDEASGVCQLLDTQGMRCEWLDEHEATKAAVLQHMEKCNWVHFACHGTQNGTKSALHLYDEPLELGDIMNRSWPHAELALLSACQTAGGEKKLPDEAAHLTAGLMVAGFRSVIGTMWSIYDVDGPEISTEFYQHLIEEGGCDTTKSAYALHHAVGALRSEVGEKEFARWMAFIHFGA